MPNYKTEIYNLVINWSLAGWTEKAATTITVPQGVGDTKDFKWRGWSKDLFGFEIFDSGIFLGLEYLASTSFDWLYLSKDFLGVQNNLKIRGSAGVKYNVLYR